MNLLLKTLFKDVVSLLELNLKQTRAKTIILSATNKRSDDDGWEGPPCRILQRLDAINMSHSTYERAGNKQSNPNPVIILHEILGSKNDWHAIAKVLAVLCRRPMITVDLRNHGRSPHTQRCTYDYMVEDIHLLFKTLQVKKAALLGHGMGGRAAMLFAHEYPHLLEKLVVVDIAPMGFASFYVKIPLVMNIMQSNCDLRAFLLNNLFRDKTGNYCWRMNLDAISRDFYQIATFPKLSTSCSVPTCFIAGGNSNCVRPDDVRRIRRLFKDVKMRFIPDADHWPQLQKRIEFLTWVGEALGIPDVDHGLDGGIKL